MVGRHDQVGPITTNYKGPLTTNSLIAGKVDDDDD